jgi:hypothetical protein
VQWTIDPRQIPSDDVSSTVCEKALRVFEARVIVRATRHVFLCPSYTDTTQASRAEVDAWLTRYRYNRNLDPPHGWYKGFLVYDPEGWKYSDNCAAERYCHHGYAIALEAERLDGTKIPIPGATPAARKTRRSRPLTVIPGGKA